MNKMRKLMLSVACGWIGLTGYGATNYVDRTRPDDSGNGLSWAAAKRTIQAAVNAAAVNDTVLVAPGNYNEGLTVTPGGYLSNRVSVTKNITLVSRDGAAATFITGARDPVDTTYQGVGPNAVRCVFMNAGTLKGFTLTGGAGSSATVEDVNTSGGGLYSPSTTTPLVYDCIFSNNAARRGGGARGGVLSRCLLTGNYASNNGAGVRDSPVYDCVIANNFGSGAAYCTFQSGIVNCTIARNTSHGTDQSRAINSIIMENGGSALNGALAASNCCLPSATSLGTNHVVTSDARFVNSAGGDYRLLANSPCLDAANAALRGAAGAPETATDFAGNPRLIGAGLDMGALEGAVPNLSAVTGEKQGAGAGSIAPATRHLLPSLPTQIVFTATAGAGSALRHFTVNGAKMKDCGDTLTLAVTQPGGYAVAAVFYPARYVDAANGSDANDGTTPATAWRTLQYAVATAPLNSMVLAAPGAYGEGSGYGASHSNRVALTRNVVLKGSAGAEQTFIMGAKDLVSGDVNGRGTNALRCVFMSAGTLEGFTLTGGASSVSVNDADGEPVRGGGLYTASSEVWDCIVSNNVSSRGAGVWGGNIHRSRIENNLFSNNGITRAGTFYDCLIVGNRGASYAVGFDSKLYNCTVSGNAGGGVSTPVSAWNTIVYGNGGAQQADNAAAFTNSCVGGSLRPGPGNISADPLFVSAAAGDYRLRADSPCVNAGNAAYGTGAGGADYAGAPRVQGGQVNMGAHETTIGAVTASATSGGTLSPAGAFLLTNDVTFTATPWPGRAFRYFETNSVAIAGGGTSLTLTAATHGNSAVSLRAVFQDGFYVDAAAGDDVNSGLETNVPLRTLQAAATLALAGDTVRVAPGTYAEGSAPSPDGSLANRLVITNAITVRSLEGAAKTFIVGARSQDASGCGADAVRCVYMSSGTLQGFTLTGGATDLAGGPTGEDFGGGLHAPSAAGTVLDCVISNNIAYTKGGGTSMATLHRCWIADNAIVGTGFGSGVRGSTVYDSVVVNNSGPSPIAYGTLFNVTAYNTTPAQNSDVYNSILFNPAGNGYTSSETARKAYNSLLTGVLNANNSGGNNLFGDPLFVNPAGLDFRVHALSPCLNSGNLSYGPGRLGADYAEAARVQGAQIDMGAYEGGVAGVRVQTAVSGGGAISPSGLLLLALPASQTFTAEPWPGRALLYFSTNGVPLPNAGNSFALTSSASASLTLTATFAGTFYADASRPDDAGDGLTEETAKRTLQAAADLTTDNDTVLAAPGVYSEGARVTPNEKTVGYLLNRVVVTNAITLRSRDGAASTIIRGAFDAGSGDPFGRGPNAVRCVYLGKGTLQGFTLTGGATDSVNLENENNRGGGVYVPENSYTQLVLDCVVSNNASVRGGGLHAGTVKRCAFFDNYAQNNSSAIRGSYAHHCLLANSRTGGNPGGSAAGYAWLYNCTLADNEGRAGDNASFFNSILTGVSISGRHFDCCLYGGTITPLTNDACFADAPLFAGSGYRLAAGSPCIDRANPAYVDNRFGTDLSGDLRTQNARADLGAYERDWRPAFAAALDGSGLTVTEITPFVTWVTNAARVGGSAVYLDGAAARSNQLATVELTAPWPLPFGPTVLLAFEVTGSGTLSLYEGAGLIGTATVADGPRTLKYKSLQNPCALRFVYAAGVGDLGGALLDGFKGAGGMTLLVR
jgi:hypothetical protein